MSSTRSLTTAMTLYICPPRSSCRTPSKTAIWSAAEAASAPRSSLICPASRRSTPCRRTMSAPSAATASSLPTAATAAALICPRRTAPSAARACGATASISRSRLSLASPATKRRPISTLTSPVNTREMHMRIQKLCLVRAIHLEREHTQV